MIVMATLLRFLGRLLRGARGGHTASVSSTQRHESTGRRLASLREQAVAPHPIARWSMLGASGLFEFEGGDRCRDLECSMPLRMDAVWKFLPCYLVT